jgi:glycosyltransferase involved in cell wall biosynthesis
MSYAFGLVASAENPTLSFVVPVKDEQATLASLFSGIAAQATKLTNCWEVIFVDDGSADQSWAVMVQLASEHRDRVKAIRFRYNAGKAAALAAGWRASTGDIVFTMDADLQDDPEEIPRFLKKISEGFDVVTGWKRDRQDPWHKVLPSRIFNFILSRVNNVKLHDHNCGFKCYRREVTHSLPMYGEMHRMVPSLAAMQGFRIAEIPVKHHPRVHGQSKYGIKRFLRGYLDMWTVFFLQNFRQRPMHLMGAVSLLMLGFDAGLALFLSRVPLPFSIFLLLSSALPALLIGSILIIMIGFLAEWNVHQSTAHTGSHPIAETIGVPIPDVEPFSPINQAVTAAAQAPLGATALLLDNKPAGREINAKCLRNAGWKVLTAGSCEEARTKLNSRVDVILFDLLVQDEPGLTVAEFVRSVRETSPAPELVFLPSSKEKSDSTNQPMPNGSGEHHLGTPSTELLNIALQAITGRKVHLPSLGIH